MLQDRSLDEPAKAQASTAEAAKTANGAGHDAPVTLPAQGPDATRIAIQALAGKALKRAWFATRRTPGGPGMHGGRIGSVARELKNPRSVHAHYINTTTIREDANDRVDANFDTGLFVFADDVGVLVDKTFMDTLGPEPTLAVETSEGSFQYFFVLNPPEPDARRYRALREALHASPVWGKAFQAGGLVQYGRLPSGENIKPEKKGFRTRLVSASLKAYTTGSLGHAFGIELGIAPVGADAMDTASTPSSPEGASPEGSSPEGSCLEGSSPEGSWRSLWCVLPRRCSPEHLRFVVGEIPNDSDFADRGDGYIPMLHAIKGAGGDTWDAFETWEWWCGQVPQYPEDEPQKRWDTVHDTAQAPIKLGFSKLLEWALRRGDAQALAKLVFGLPRIAERLAVDGRLDEGGGEHPREVVDRVVDTGGAKKKPRSLGDVTALARAGLRAIAAPVAKDVYEELAANDEHDLPEIIMPGIERMESTLIGGPSGAMKSLFVQQAAVAATVSAPKPIGEKAVDFCGPAVFYANEDSPRLVKKRINAICLKHGLTRPYKHKLFVRTGQVLKRNDKGAIDWNWDEVNALLDILAQEGDIAMIVLDTLAASLPSEETNLEFQQVIDKTRELAREIRAAVVIVHHFRKGTPGAKEEEPTLEAVRGGSALTAAARNVMFAEKPNKADKVKYGLTDDQAKTTMKLTHVKCSYGPLSPTKWFKLGTAPIKVRDRRDGSLGHEDQPALIPIALSDIQHRLGVLRDAWNKLDAWIKSGQRVFQSSASRGKPGFAQAVLGVKSDRETNEILSDLVKHDIIEIVETTDGGHKKREIISRNLGFSARLEEVDEDVENTEETPY